VSVAIHPTSIGATPTPVEPPVQLGPESQFPIEALIGGALLLGVLGYAVLYGLGLRAIDRYKAGFVVERCPVCGRGHLTVETRRERLFGIPRARRTVRCDECRSVLRETASRRWRYAIDPIENSALYRQYNGHEIDEATLIELARSMPSSETPVRPRPPATPPNFIDEDQP
jgi:hypothetical protein